MNHRYKRESAAGTATLRTRVEHAAISASLVTLALLALGAPLFAAGILPSALAALYVPLMVFLAATFGVTALAQSAGTLREAKPLRYSRAALNLGWAVFLVAGQLGRGAGLWGLDAAFLTLPIAGAAIGVGLLADALRDSGRHAYPRLAVISSALGGTGILMIAGTILSGANGDVSNRLFLMGVALLAAAAFGVVRLRRIHRSRAELLDRMGLGDR